MTVSPTRGFYFISDIYYFDHPTVSILGSDNNQYG